MNRQKSLRSKTGWYIEASQQSVDEDSSSVVSSPGGREVQELTRFLRESPSSSPRTTSTLHSVPIGSASGAFSTPVSVLNRPNRPANLMRESPTATSTPGNSKMGTLGGEGICVPPVLLSPVLSRPVRPLSATSSPLPFRHQNSDSESDHGSVQWRGGTNMARRSLASSMTSGGTRADGSRPNTPVMSPILNRSASGSRLASAFQCLRSSGSGHGLIPGRTLLTRTDSKSEDRQSKRRRRRTMLHGMCSESSMESATGWSSSCSWSNLSRMRACLGHSDPQISATSTHAINIKMKEVTTLSQTSRSSAARRSLNASTSPVLAPRCRSPRQQGASVSCRTAPVTNIPLRSYSTRNGSQLMAPQHDNRRWSLASLPSTSGYGTPGSNSAFSSQYSSSEHLSELLENIRVGGGGSAGGRFDSNDSCPSQEDTIHHSSPHGYRPRSRSLTSPVIFNSEFRLDVVNRNSVYMERFPKAKVQMEGRLQSFMTDNAPLSGGSSGETDVSERNNRKSMVLEAETCADKNLLRLIGDGATRFLHHQIVEIASDCLTRSIDDSITCTYFCEMSQRLEETLNEAQQKTSFDSFNYLSKLVKQLLMIVSRPARLLECLEFDPDEFYQLLEEAEGVVREQLGSGDARVPDLPQYIIGKLGLDRDPMLECERDSPPPTTSTASQVVNTEKTVVGGRKSCEDTSTGPRSVGGAAKWSEQRPPCEDDFDTIRLVSNGAYGAVYLVRHRDTRQRFALKKMNKQTLMLRNQIDQVFAERDILTMTDNPFVVSFYGSFETRHHLCMLMEYVEGGDCAALLKNAGTLPLDLARLYIAETVLAIEYLHSYGIVHRDLKPDNLLITAMGHIKLTDFGLSKIGLMSRTTLVAEGGDSVDTQQFKDKQLCGTPEYIAPEVIIRQGYGKPVDFWALGVILYEFLVGIVPFSGETPEDLFSAVISEEVEYPTGEEALLPEAEDLMRKLLEKNPAERLGTVAGAIQLTTHPFFANLDFTSLLREKAEFVPQLDNDEDTSYFDTRSDRYNHDAESCGEEETMTSSPMFHSFSTASPRHSIATLDPAHLPPSVLAQCDPMSRSAEGPVSRARAASTTTQSSEDAHDSQDYSDRGQDPNSASAVLLRRRFSAQRQANLSTSSSGTTGTGYQGNAYSSTDSSMDASHVAVVHVQDPRRSPLPRFAISCDPEEQAAAGQERAPKELSPVDETVRFRSQPPSPLQLVIPPSGQGTSGSAKDTCYVMSSSGGPVSPGGSQGSASSIESSPHQTLELSPAGSSTKPSINIRKGPMGFGFTLKSVRVYLSEDSDYYTIEHIITSVVQGSPAWDAGLRPDDLVTVVNGQPVHNLTHPQLMHRLLSYGNELTLKVTPMSSTTIKEGAPRKHVGKLAKKKPKRPQRRVPLEKKPRKPSSLLRRLSGKRSTNDIVPGSSSQKQTFIPRSVSSQDGVILSGPSTVGGTIPAVSSVASTSTSTAAPSTSLSATGGHQGVVHKRMSDVGIRDSDHRSPLVCSRPSSLRGLKQETKTLPQPIPVSPLARTEDCPNMITRSPSPSRSTSSGGRSLMNRLLHKDDHR